MFKENKRTLLLTSAVCLLPVVAGLILYKDLPDPMITHWDYNGEPNGYMPKFAAVIILPAVLLVINLFTPALLKMDPKYNNMNDKIIKLILWTIPAVSVFCASTTLAVGLGFDSKLAVTAPLFTGLIFVIIGNYLPKTRQTYTVGIKLPWTLNDEDNWNRTHRMAGYLWIVCGFLIMASVLIPGSKYMILALIVIMIFAPAIYSFTLYAKSNK